MANDKASNRPWTIEGALIWLQTENEELANSLAGVDVDPLSIAGFRIFPGMSPEWHTKKRTFQEAAATLLGGLQLGAIVAHSPKGPIPQGQWMATASLDNGTISQTRFDKITAWSADVRALLAAATECDAPSPADRSNHGPNPRPPPNKQKRHGGKDFRKDDEPLVAEMRNMIQTRVASGPWDAADRVAERAAGGGTAESKRKRLFARYSEAFGTEHNGAD